MSARVCFRGSPLHNVLPTAQGALKEGAALLNGRTPTPSTDAAVLLGHVTGVDRIRMLAHGDAALSSDQYARYRNVLAQRSQGMPIAYITSCSGFFKRTFVVNEAVLIPRPETEHVVEAAIAYLNARLGEGARTVTVLEIGVGSGAIACSIASEVPQAHIVGTDISVAALKAAHLNADRLGVLERCSFSLADIVGEAVPATFDVVVANLPYIPRAHVPAKPDPVGFEPRIALDGGPDGLEVYRRMLIKAREQLRGAGLVLMEAAPPTIPGLRGLTAAALPGAFIEVRRDYAGLERFLYVRPR